MCQDLLSLRRKEKCIILICLTSMFEIMLVPLENTTRKGCKNNYKRKILLWIRKKWLGSSLHVPSLHTIVNKTHFLLGQRGRGGDWHRNPHKEKNQMGEDFLWGHCFFPIQLQRIYIEVVSRVANYLETKPHSQHQVCIPLGVWPKPTVGLLISPTNSLGALLVS